MKRLKAGHWIDEETGEVIASGLPRSLQSVVDSALAACAVLGRADQLRRITDSPRGLYENKALIRRARERLAELEAERDTLVARIEHGWGWCDRHRDHERFAEREGHVVAWIGQYESVCRAISAAKAAL